MRVGYGPTRTTSRPRPSAEGRCKVRLQRAIKSWIGSVDKINRALSVPVNCLMWLACFSGFLMMAHITIDVVGRVLFNHPFQGTIEIVSAYYMVAISFLPLAYITRHEGHIVVELFTRGLSKRRLFRLDIAVNIVTLVYLTVFASRATVSAIGQTERGEMWETAAGFVDVWPSRWLLPIGIAVMALFVLYKIFEDMRQVRQNSGETAP